MKKCRYCWQLTDKMHFKCNPWFLGAWCVFLTVIAVVIPQVLVSCEEAPNETRTYEKIVSSDYPGKVWQCNYTDKEKGHGICSDLDGKEICYVTVKSNRTSVHECFQVKR